MSLLFQHLHHVLKGWKLSHKTSKDLGCQSYIKMLCLKTTAQAINAANYLNLNWLPHLISSHMTFESGFPHV